MGGSPYDGFAEAYAAQLPVDLEAPATVQALAAAWLLGVVGDVAGLAVLDLGCGEGHLARRLQAAGGHVTGVDISTGLLEIARRRGGGPRYIRGDAQDLRDLADASFDIVFSNLALMDIPDLAATAAAVRRVLRPAGRFVCTLVHPCFGPPGGDDLLDAEGRFLARTVPRYAEEGFWRSEQVGSVRHAVGAHHRTLSTYINTLLAAGLGLRGLAEPTLPPGDHTHPRAQAHVRVPPLLVVDAVRLPDGPV